MRPEVGTTPNPDPTEYTNAAIDRAVEAERDWVEGQLGVLRERLNGIDRATELRLELLHDLPARIDEKINCEKDVSEQKFNSVQNQFTERDIRAEREARDNKVAVDAAFAAQKEAAAKQDEANAKAIDKSERATSETIKTNSELSRTTNDALRMQLDDLKERVSRIESRKEGAVETRTQERATISTTTQVIGAIVAVAVIALALYAAVQNGNGQPAGLIEIVLAFTN